MPNYERPVRALIVDEDIANRERMAQIVRGAAASEGLEVQLFEASEGQEAWEQVLSHHPDLILSEVLLRKLSGMDLLRRLKDRQTPEANKGSENNGASPNGLTAQADHPVQGEQKSSSFRSEFSTDRGPTTSVKGPSLHPALIFVSHLNEEVDRYWGLRNGALAYVAKPYEDKLLASRIQRFFSGGYASRQSHPMSYGFES